MDLVLFAIALHLVIESGPTFWTSFPAIHIYLNLFRTNCVFIYNLLNLDRVYENDCQAGAGAKFICNVFVCKCLQIYRESKVYLISRGECPSHISFNDSGSRTVFTAEYAGTERPSPFYTSSLRCTERLICYHNAHYRNHWNPDDSSVDNQLLPLLPAILIASKCSDMPAPGFGHAVGLLLPAEAQE